MTADQIEDLVRQDRKIFPVTYKEKKPDLVGWQEFALQENTDELLTDLLTTHHKAEGEINLGMIVGSRSDVLTIDMDFKHPEAEKFWLDWKDSLEQGLVVNTGNGKHCHFKHPGSKVVSSIGGISRGVDLLCDTIEDDGAKYVVIPDSLHPCGAHYEYDDCNGDLTLADDLPYMPLDIEALVFDKSKWGGHSSEAQATTEMVNPAQWYADNPHMLFNVDPFDDEAIPEGNRNNDMAKIAGKLLYMNDDNHNYLPEDLKGDMKAVNVLRCTPPLEEAEVNLMCDSIYKVKIKRDTKIAKQREGKEVELVLGPDREAGGSEKTPGCAFGAGVLPAPSERPSPKEDVNAAALWVLHQEPYKPDASSGTHKLIFLEADFYQHFNNVWRRVSEQSIRSTIQSYFFSATKTNVSNIVSFMQNYLYYPVKNIPFWRGAAPANYPADPRKLIPFENGLLDIEAYLRSGDMQGSLKPHTDSLFNTVKMTYALDENAKCPRWESFLASLWGSAKSDRAEALREWSGHMMLPDVTQQKIAVLHGSSRSGKSTIGKVLHKLIGTENSAATSLHSMASDHGASALVGKTMAIMYDAHLPVKGNGDKALEVLKSISGGDPQTINRKYHDPYTVLLTTRMMMICNEIPKFSDAGNALINRILSFRFDISFIGREDHNLETTLTGELQGIAVWALIGIKKYVTRGFLMTPREATQDLQDLKRIMNPTSAFVDDCVVYPTSDPNDEISAIELYQAYIEWADSNNMTYKLTKDRLLDKVKGICNQLSPSRRNNVLYWRGLKLREEVTQSNLF